MSPLGHVMFCDGVFHRSQLETPYGITRGIDATTYRFDLRKGTKGFLFYEEFPLDLVH